LDIPFLPPSKFKNNTFLNNTMTASQRLGHRRVPPQPGLRPLGIPPGNSLSLLWTGSAFTGVGEEGHHPHTSRRACALGPSHPSMLFIWLYPQQATLTSYTPGLLKSIALHFLRLDVLRIPPPLVRLLRDCSPGPCQRRGLHRLGTLKSFSQKLFKPFLPLPLQLYHHALQQHACSLGPSPLLFCSQGLCPPRLMP
jgi:hypothetical protein